ncbi:MAG: hypothetical protein R3F59_34225 [Myxococcota bacterium]
MLLALLPLPSPAAPLDDLDLTRTPGVAVAVVRQGEVAFATWVLPADPAPGDGAGYALGRPTPRGACSPTAKPATPCGSPP